MFSVGLFCLRPALVSYLCICTIGFAFAVRGILHILESLNLDSTFPTRGDIVTTFMFHRSVPWIIINANVTRKFSIIPM